MSDVSPEKALKTYMLEEFKRRHALDSLRKELQDNMPEKYINLWWCKDEALREIHKQFVHSTNHCVIDNFLGEDAAQNVLNEVKIANDSNLLSTDGMLTFQGRNETVRTDVLGWFDCTAPPTENASFACCFDSEQTGDEDNAWPWLHHLLQRMETVVSELGSVMEAPKPNSSIHSFESTLPEDIVRRDFQLCTSRSRVMVTKYEGKDDLSSHYDKHLDNGNKNGRKVTAIYYVNKDWRRVNGGCLRLYLRNHCNGVKKDTEKGTQNKFSNDNRNNDFSNGEANEIYCDVEPLFDRLVLFMSDARTPHEVLPTHKDRFAVTVWFWDHVEKAASERVRNNGDQ